MRLKKLYVKDYKNLKNFTVDFESGNGLSILIGNNGSGKSNLLEIISGIFHDLFKEKSSRKIDCDYSLEYELDGISCKTEQRDGTLRCYAPKLKPRDKFISENTPNSVIGLYSGEEDRLWTQFYQPYYNAYIRRIQTNRYQDRMRLILIDKRYWNIALLTLLLSNNSTLEPFIKEELGITTIDKIRITFNFHHYQSSNELLKSFIDRINPEHVSVKIYSRDELCQGVFYDFLADENGDVLADENGNALLADSGITDFEVFRYLTQSSVSTKDRLITGITIFINDGITVQQLSEGEKKLILVKTVLEILADEKALVLMDEPDAHLHEERKPALIRMVRDYPNRQIVVATHSPIIAQIAQEKELLMLESKDGKATLMSDEKREKIKRLTGSAWDIIGQDMIFQSTKPLVIFEGETDVKYVKRALELIKQIKPEYNAFSADLINANGAGNVKSFIDNLLEVISPTKKLIVFFDRDDAGQKGAAAVAGLSKNDERIVHYQDIPNGNIIVSFIPYKDGITDGDFLIEDYFLWDGTLNQIFEGLIPEKKNPIKNLPNLSDRLKKSIEKKLYQFELADFMGFIPLLDKIMNLSQDR